MTLKELRVKWGMTQPEMARLIHVSRTQWQRYEHGKQVMPLAYAELLHYKLTDKANEVNERVDDEQTD